MQQTVSTNQSWTYVLLAIPLGVLAAYMGTLYSWTPGAAMLAVMAVPTTAAALSGQKSTAFAVALLASLGCFAESAIVTPEPHSFENYSFAFFTSCGLFAIAATGATLVNRLRNRIDQLEEQKTQFVRDLYQRGREDEKTEQLDNTKNRLATDGSIEEGNRNAEKPEGQSVDFAMLLLTLQDIGRRISGNLDIETLIPTIISSAKTSLKCKNCQVYMWNAEEGTLQNALPPRYRDEGTYNPRPKVGMTRWVLENRQILTRDAVSNDYSLQSLLEEDPLGPTAIAPLSVGSEVLGLIIVDGVEQETNTFVRLLYILANIYAMGIKNAQLFSRIEDMARRDGLTGLLNHASFQKKLQECVDESFGDSNPISVVMCDVDHFKKFNDTYGHQAGDHVLREVSRLWKSVVPQYAELARYGGEEFICVLPNSDLKRGAELAELMRNTVDSYVFEFEGEQFNVTASFGVAELGKSSQSAQELIRRSDEALYAAKKAGRNRVCVEGDVQVAGMAVAETT